MSHNVRCRHEQRPALGIQGPHRVRDLWRQCDLADADGHYAVEIPRHGVHLVRMQPAK